MRIASLLPAVLLTLALAGCQPANPVLEIEGGKIQGVESSAKGVYVYKGIPFAAPPVGDLRWKEPQPVVPWEGVKVADTFGPGAMQAKHDSSNPWTSEFYWEDPEFSEDCLYLNVWTPAPGKPGKKLPVAMWIHGGAYTGGWGYEPEFDGKVWAEKGVVLVTINYRLGVFGFLVHPFLTAESPHQVSGNYGLLDQVAALKWIHANIAAFGLRSPPLRWLSSAMPRRSFSTGPAMIPWRRCATLLPKRFSPWRTAMSPKPGRLSGWLPGLSWTDTCPRKASMLRLREAGSRTSPT